MNKWGPWLLVIGFVLFVTVVAVMCGDAQVQIK